MLLLLDVENLPAINDKFGYGVSDDVLQDNRVSEPTRPIGRRKWMVAGEGFEPSTFGL